MGAGLADQPDIFALAVVFELAEIFAGQNVGKAEDGVERRAQLVADGGQEARLGVVGRFAPRPPCGPRRRAAAARGRCRAAWATMLVSAPSASRRAVMSMRIWTNWSPSTATVGRSSRRSTAWRRGPGAARRAPAGRAMRSETWTCSKKPRPSGWRIQARKSARSRPPTVVTTALRIEKQDEAGGGLEHQLLARWMMTGASTAAASGATGRCCRRRKTGRRRRRWQRRPARRRPGW